MEVLNQWAIYRQATGIQTLFHDSPGRCCDVLTLVFLFGLSDPFSEWAEQLFEQEPLKKSPSCGRLKLHLPNPTMIVCKLEYWSDVAVKVFLFLSFALSLSPSPWLYRDWFSVYLFGSLPGVTGATALLLQGSITKNNYDNNSNVFFVINRSYITEASVSILVIWHTRAYTCTWEGKYYRTKYSTSL